MDELDVATRDMIAIIAAYERDDLDHAGEILAARDNDELRRLIQLLGIFLWTVLRHEADEQDRDLAEQLQHLALNLANR